MSKSRPKFSFGEQSPAARLKRLQRDLLRIAESSFLPNDLNDFGNDFASTAWHMVESVWIEKFKNDQEAYDALLTDCGDMTEMEKRTIQRFKEYLTCKCPELALCQDIATATKHPAYKPPGNRQSPGVNDVTASGSMVTSPAFILDQGCLDSGALGGPRFKTGGQMYRLKITGKDDVTHDALAVFDKVYAFWNRFLHDNGLMTDPDQ
jgi:hypothetical protein